MGGAELMKRCRSIVAGGAAISIALAGVAFAGGANHGPCDPAPTSDQKTQIATAKLIIEYNATDEDVGVHGAFDDDGWEWLCVFDPSGRPVLRVGPRNQLRDLTMAGIFFESREPPFAKFDFAELQAAFPEGRYRVRGASFDGAALVGQATFSHDVPAEPEITSPGLGPDPETPGPVVPEDGLVVRWDPVTQTVDGGPVDVTGYEVIVTKEEHEDPNGFSQPIYDVHVGPDVHQLPVPDEFLEPGTAYELEVLALEVSGNQTISVRFFQTA
jgi:hypothetical protein